VATETILKIYNTLVLPTFLYGSENWTLTSLQRRRIEAAEMKLLWPLAGYTLYDHNTNDYIRCELRITGILDKIDEYRRNWFSTLAKNATKPNPFEIIPLQTTWKENNWKTEEALARAAVTVETERTKGPNPWCLWWWWWWWLQKGHQRYTQIKSYSPATRSGITYTTFWQHCAKVVTLYTVLTVHHTGTRPVTNRIESNRIEEEEEEGGGGGGGGEEEEE